MLTSWKYPVSTTLARTRFIALVGLMLAITCGLATGATPASAVEGMHPEEAASLLNSSSPKSAEARCPINERVIGGGGWVSDAPAGVPKPTLTELRPTHFTDV